MMGCGLQGCRLFTAASVGVCWTCVRALWWGCVGRERSDRWWWGVQNRTIYSFKIANKSCVKAKLRQSYGQDVKEKVMFSSCGTESLAGWPQDGGQGKLCGTRFTRLVCQISSVTPRGLPAA